MKVRTQMQVGSGKDRFYFQNSISEDRVTKQLALKY